MESKKVKEIKSWLNNVGKVADCSIYYDTLTLINELESENKWLSSKYRNLEINYNDAWEQYREYEVENRQLKARIAELKKENAGLLQVINDLENIDTKLQNTCAICEAELKHFAERLKEKLFDLGNIVNENDIDETLKELQGGEI